MTKPGKIRTDRIKLIENQDHDLTKSIFRQNKIYDKPKPGLSLTKLIYDKTKSVLYSDYNSL